MVTHRPKICGCFKIHELVSDKINYNTMILYASGILRVHACYMHVPVHAAVNVYCVC